MTPYDSQFQPPAPIASVRLWNLNTRADKGVRLAIDTGADVTLVPASAIADLEIQLVKDRTFQLAGFDGTHSEASAVDLGMEWLGKKIRGRFLLIDRDLGILGRDVLNHFRIVLDGPKLEWGEE
jgi:hypothetical protein